MVLTLIQQGLSLRPREKRALCGKMPKDDSCPSQFGFRDNRGTTVAVALFNDVTSYFRYRGSPMYTCTVSPRINVHALISENLLCLGMAPKNILAHL